MRHPIGCAIYLDITVVCNSDTAETCQLPRPKPLEGWGKHLFIVAEEDSVGFQSCLKDFAVLFIFQTHRRM